MEVKILEAYQNDPNHPERQQIGSSISRRGIVLDLSNPEDPNLVEFISDIQEVAIALSNINRYAGNYNAGCYGGMSVAEHCIRGAEAFLIMGQPLLAKYFLLHEIEEAVGWSDIPGPIKKLIPSDSPVKKYSENIERKMCEIYNLEYPFPAEIKTVDISISQLEMVEMKMSPINDIFVHAGNDLVNWFIHTFNKIEAILERDFETNKVGFIPRNQ